MMRTDGLLWVLAIMAIPVIAIAFPDAFGAVAVAILAVSVLWLAVWIPYCKLTGRDWRD